MRRAVALLGAALLLVAACSSDDGTAGGRPTGGAGSTPSAFAGDQLTPQVGTLPQAALEIMTGPPFDGARWAAQITDAETDETVLALNAHETLVMASVAKLFWVGAALDALGADYTMTTPVHRVGDDLVLVASGDLVMGGRNAGADELGYSIPPQPDANGLPGAKPAPGDPLAGLDELAKQVAASGITSVPGDVLIDDRLFDTWDSDSGPVTPIVINDNLLDVLVTPGTGPGDHASIRTIPDTSAFKIENQVATVASGDQAGTSIDITPGDGNRLVVSGTIEAGSDEVLNVYGVPDPAAYARTLFIEALGRAGVSVAADPLVTPADDALPSPSAYDDANTVASLESPPYREQAQLIWKISHTLGARLALCLTAVELGSTDCLDGYDTIREHMETVDIDETTVWFPPTNEATSADSAVKWVGWMADTFGAETIEPMLPIMGVDGSLGFSGKGSPAAGRIWAKTGTAAAGDLATGRLLIPAKALAGFMEAPDGHLYYFALFVANASYDSPKDQTKAADDLADVAIALQQSL